MKSFIVHNGKEFIQQIGKESSLFMIITKKRILFAKASSILRKMESDKYFRLHRGK